MQYNELTINSFAVRGMKGAMGIEKLKAWALASQQADNSTVQQKAILEALKDSDDREKFLELWKSYQALEKRVPELKEALVKENDVNKKKEIRETLKELDDQIIECNIGLLQYVDMAKSEPFSMASIDQKSDLMTLLYDGIVACVETMDYQYEGDVATYIKEMMTKPQVDDIIHNIGKDDDNILATDPSKAFFTSIPQLKPVVTTEQSESPTELK